jgi:hypothetical protein
LFFLLFFLFCSGLLLRLREIFCFARVEAAEGIVRVELLRECGLLLLGELRDLLA